MSTTIYSPVMKQPSLLKNHSKAILSSICLIALLAGSLLTPFTPKAEAYRRYNNDRYYGNDYRGGNRPIVGYQTGKILKGGLVGAGIGAGSAVVFDKPLLKTSIIGAGIGAGVQALRYSNW